MTLELYPDNNENEKNESELTSDINPEDETNNKKSEIHNSDSEINQSDDKFETIEEEIQPEYSELTDENESEEEAEELDFESRRDKTRITKNVLLEDNDAEEIEDADEISDDEKTSDEDIRTDTDFKIESQTDEINAETSYEQYEEDFDELLEIVVPNKNSAEFSEAQLEDNSENESDIEELDVESRKDKTGNSLISKLQEEPGIDEIEFVQPSKEFEDEKEEGTSTSVDEKQSETGDSSEYKEIKEKRKDILKKAIINKAAEENIEIKIPQANLENAENLITSELHAEITDENVDDIFEVPLEEEPTSYSYETVLEILKIDEQELMQLVSIGQLRAFRYENQTRFDREDVDALLAIELEFVEVKQSEISSIDDLLKMIDADELSDYAGVDKDEASQQAAVIDETKEGDYLFEEVLELLKIDSQELMFLVSSGRVSAYRDDNQTKFSKSDINALRGVTVNVAEVQTPVSGPVEEVQQEIATEVSAMKSDSTFEDESLEMVVPNRPQHPRVSHQTSL